MGETMKRMSFIKHLLIFIIFFIDGLTLAHATNVCENIGVGGRSLGMGGVDIGIAADTSAMVSNPAGITQIKGGRADFGNGLFFPWVRFTNKDNAFDSSDHGRDYEPFFFYLPEWGWVKHPSQSSFSWGIGLFAVGGGGSGFQLKNQFFPEGKRVESKLAYIKFTPTVAYQITPKLSAGLALNVYYSPLNLKGLFGPVYVVVDHADAWGGGYALGVLYQPTDRLKVGIAYTSESMLADYETDKGYVQIAGQAMQQYHAKVVDFQLPQKVGVGISYQFTPKLLVGLDAEWQDYSHAFRKIAVEMEGLSIPPANLAWEDSYHFAIGAEYKITPRFTLRAGYAYTGEGVTPNEGTFPYIPSTTGNSHNLTAGWGYSWNNYLLDFGWSHHLDVEDRNGRSRIGEDYENSTLGFGDNLYMITVSYLYAR